MVHYNVSLFESGKCKRFGRVYLLFINTFSGNALRVGYLSTTHKMYTRKSISY